MELSDSQAAAFADRGYLFFPGLLSAAEAAPLQAAVPEILARQGPEVVREQEDPTAARLAFGAHTYSEPFRRLALLPRLLNPVRRLLQDEVYLHQSRLNPKQGFGSGASWTWHQDFPPWHSIDGMPEPRCIMASVFVDDCTVARSPLLILPGSHRRGLLDSKPHQDSVGKEYELHHIGREEFGRLADEHGIEPLVGPGRLRLLRPLQHHPRLGGQRLPLAAGDSVPDLQRRQQCLHRQRAGLVPQQPRLHSVAGGRRRRPAHPVAPARAVPASIRPLVHPAASGPGRRPAHPVGPARGIPRVPPVHPGSGPVFQVFRGT